MYGEGRGRLMSISSQVFNWLASTYSEGFFRTWGSVVFVCILLHVAEHLIPAERNQSYRSMITNGQITLVYAFLTPIARFGGLFFAGYVVAMLAS